ncbi:MAG TPA: ectonucleotide pyrophosphatase/phosphodiesterase [Novosphingobium sp.]|nr:ectonucleotide pyrophosphatase/phosphodiesterase [Novosphingobium sp.]
MARLGRALAGVVMGAGFILAPIAHAQGQKQGSAGHPVLMISIDGLRPGDVLQAAQRGMKLPNLRRFVQQGAYASGVTGVLPTLTYPSHTTLITGVAPAAHGVVSNTTFDPTAINADGWYWYSSDIRATTLWQAAHGAGLTTANVHWPVSVGAQGIDWNLPQIWRTGHADDAKLLAALATPGLPAALERDGDTYAQGKDESIAGDANRTRFAVRLIGRHKPGFVTVYLAGLDHVEHQSGPDTPEAHAALEQLDADVGALVEAEQAAHPDATIALVSDHGFAPVDTAFNLSRALIDAGLLQVGKGPTGAPVITGWEAAAWASGGSVAVVLARPDDAALRAKVAALLNRLKADPANRITRMLEQPAITAQGGNPQAAFYIDLGPGMMAFPYLSPDLPLVGPTPYKGMHGYFPSAPEMNATFMLMGPGVPKGRDLGQIDMRVIAPTLARIMGAQLPDAQAAALAF